MNARAITKARLTDETLDVLVIGGGMFGACVALDAAVRGPVSYTHVKVPTHRGELIPGRAASS